MCVTNTYTHILALSLSLSLSLSLFLSLSLPCPPPPARLSLTGPITQDEGDKLEPPPSPSDPPGQDQEAGPAGGGGRRREGQVETGGPEAGQTFQYWDTPMRDSCQITEVMVVPVALEEEEEERRRGGGEGGGGQGGQHRGEQEGLRKALSHAGDGSVGGTGRAVWNSIFGARDTNDKPARCPPCHVTEAFMVPVAPAEHDEHEEGRGRPPRGGSGDGGGGGGGGDGGRGIWNSLSSLLLLRLALRYACASCRLVFVLNRNRSLLYLH